MSSRNDPLSFHKAFITVDYIYPVIRTDPDSCLSANFIYFPRVYYDILMRVCNILMIWLSDNEI